MSATSEKASEIPTPSLGFLTVCELENLGLVGGLLLVNRAGRPLEFHCTAPIRATRAQEILYGATLAPFLYGEQIGRALVERASRKADAFFTDIAAVLAVQEFVEAPVIALDAEGEGPGRQRISCGGRTWTFAETAAPGATQVSATVEDFDLIEPLDRIREAIREAQRDAKPRAAA